MYTIKNLSDKLFTTEEKLIKTLISHGYLKKDGTPKSSSINSKLMNKNGLISQNGWKYFCGEFDASELLINIAKNEEPQKVFDNINNKTQSVYYNVVNSQINAGIKQMHLPEPWNGHLTQAQIMFIGSNPSFCKEEEFPTKYWSKNKIISFFENRFYNYEKDDASLYWKYLIKYTDWTIDLIDDISKEKIRNSDRVNDRQFIKENFNKLNDLIVSTEIVHCKSKKEKGTLNRKLLDEEFKQWMPQIINKFKGKIIILFGNMAGNYLEKIRDLTKNKNIIVIQQHHLSHNPQTDDEKREELKNAIKAAESKIL